MMKELQQLGLDEKESRAFLILLEYGTQPASVIAKKLKIARTTTLYILENLYKQKMVNKSFQGKTQYYTANLNGFNDSRQEEYTKKLVYLKKIIPNLQKIQSKQKSPARIEFFEGITGCQNAYKKILESKSEILEFAAHTDLEAMGVKFMQDIIKTRTKNKKKIKVIAENTKIHREYNKLNKKQFREMKMFPSKNGKINSSITFFDNEVIIMNLIDEPFAIHITNKHIVESLKTIHNLIYNEPSN